MKNFLAVLIFSITALIMQGCVNEDTNYSLDSKPQSTVGTLSFSKMSVAVMEDVEKIISTTRSADATNTDAYIVKVVSANGSEVISFEYAQRPTTPIELEAGLYTVEVMSAEIPDAAWDTPVFQASHSVTILRGEEAVVGEFVCKLANVKIFVVYPEDLSEVMGDDIKTDVTVGNSTLTFAKDEVRSAYFRVPEENATAKFVVSGTLDGESVDIKHEETDLKAGQWRDVAINFHYVPYKIPVIKWGDKDLSQRYVIPEEGMDVKVDIMAGNSIAGLSVDIISDVLTEDILGAIGLSSHLDLANPGETEGMLRDLGLPTSDEVVGHTEVSFDISVFMAIIYQFGAGNSDFKVMVTDNVGNTTEATLMFVVE